MNTIPTGTLVAVEDAPPGGRWSPLRRRWIFGVTAVLVAAIVAAAGTVIAGRDDLTRPAAGSPWEAAGITRVSVTGSSGAVTVRAETREDLTVGLTTDPVRYARRVAKVVWRNQTGPLRTLSLSIVNPGRAGQRATGTWTRAVLVEQFGPRPAGLDDGRPATLPAPALGGVYRAPTATSSTEAVDLLRGITAGTITGHLHIAAPATSGPAPATIDCVRTATPRANIAIAPVRVQVDGIAEAALPGIAAYWAGLGLQLTGDDLDTGTPAVSVHWDAHPDLGGITVEAVDVHLLVFMGATGCLPAGRP